MGYGHRDRRLVRLTARPAGAPLALLASLYLSQGLPYGFFVQALPVMLRESGRSLPEIGAASLLALPWGAKALWAPLVDRFGSARFGRRRSWIVPCQLGAAALMAALGVLPAGDALGAVLAGFLLANLLAATQDIATDALAVTLLPPGLRGIGNGLQVAGYRVGMVIGGGALLAAWPVLGWAGVFFSMAALLALATLPVLLVDEPPPPPRAVAARPPGLVHTLRRPGMARWLGALAAAKAGEALAGGMVRPFLLDQGLSVAQLGLATGTIGAAAGLAGALLGGVLVGLTGRLPALIALGLAQALTVGAWAALPGAPVPVLLAAVGLEHLVGGMFTVALFTRMMDACRPASAGTDYTLQASVVVLATGAAAALSGFSAQALGYPGHFALAGLLCLAGLGALPWLAGVPGERAVTPSAPPE